MTLPPKHAADADNHKAGHARVLNTNTDIFISDLHLCASRPHITQMLLSFLQNTVIQCRALYILGDLFEYWAGDDDIDDIYIQPIITALKSLHDAGIAVYFMHGNRDFLIAEHFACATHATLLQDPTCINLHGKNVLLSHGDALCTDDVAYQAFRRQVRAHDWKQNFLSLPLATRKQQIEAIRMRSEQEKSQKSADIMDINPQALHQLLSLQGYPELLIHGHTHRPDQHIHAVDGHVTTRWVLGDWYEQGSYLLFDDDGCRAVSLETTSHQG